VAVLQNDSILVSNAAFGGNCGFPGCGTNAPAGNAFGGGLYGGTGSTLTIGAVRIVGNRATGATGIGGGIYAAGTLTLSPNAIVAGNFASTADPNIFPPGV
jgi:predicted outer membrane repeat protein